MFLQITKNVSSPVRELKHNTKQTSAREARREIPGYLSKIQSKIGVRSAPENRVGKQNTKQNRRAKRAGNRVGKQNTKQKSMHEARRGILWVL